MPAIKKHTTAATQSSPPEQSPIANEMERQGLSRTPARVKRKEEQQVPFWDGLPPSDALDCRQCDSCVCTDCEAETETDEEDFFE